MTPLMSAAVHSGARLLPDFCKPYGVITRRGRGVPKTNSGHTFDSPTWTFEWDLEHALTLGSLGLPLCVNLNLSSLLQLVPTLPIRIGAAPLGS